MELTTFTNVTEADTIPSASVFVPLLAAALPSRPRSQERTASLNQSESLLETAAFATDVRSDLVLWAAAGVTEVSQTS